MALIKIEIDPDKTSSEGTHKKSFEGAPISIFTSSKPIVLISTITLSKDLTKAFTDGALQKPLVYDGVDYDNLPNVLRQFDGPNRLIVTTGGLIAFKAAKANLTTAYFVSLVGAAPAGVLGRCLGGVIVSSFSANRARVAFLVGKGRAVGGIGLFCNPKSPMNTDEEGDWGGIAGVNQTIIHGGNGQNDPTHYNAEFAQASAAGITSLVISASPFFFYTREKLIAAANNWIAGAAPGTRYVCYPFDDYGNAGGQNHPTGGTASWYGGSLVDAYGAIGVTAALELNSTTGIPFSPISDTSGDF
jgi:hypothetical protein